jgi:hypothetical protein
VKSGWAHVAALTMVEEKGGLGGVVKREELVVGSKDVT